MVQNETPHRVIAEEELQALEAVAMLPATASAHAQRLLAVVAEVRRLRAGMETLATTLEPLPGLAQQVAKGGPLADCFRPALLQYVQAALAFAQEHRGPKP